MTTHRLSRIAIAALVVCTVNPLLADSDGYFCFTSSYLAYDVGFSGSSSHELRLVSLASPLSRDSLRAIPLPDFQVHGMLCTETEVLVLGWDTLYTASLLPETQPPSLSSEKLAYGGFRPSAFSETDGTRNLGSVAKPQVLPLGGPQSDLVLVTEVKPSGRECELRIVSRLEEADQEGRVRFALELYDGRRGAECCGE
jgi:hypothetical protein